MGWLESKTQMMNASEKPGDFLREIGRGIAEGIGEGLGWILIAIAFAAIAIVRQSASLSNLLMSTKQTTFKPYQVHTPYFIDESPPGSYDLTLERDGNQSVEIPSPCNGTIADIWYQGTASGKNGNGGGQIVEVVCEEYIWLFAHLEVNPPVIADEAIAKGQSIGIQGLTGRTTGHHIHLQIHHNLNGKRGERVVNRAITRPMVEHYIQWLRQGGDIRNAKSGRGADKYQRAIAMTATFEGGCQNSKADPGNYFQGERGYTCAGLTPETAWRYRDWIGLGNFQGSPVEFSKWAYERSPEKFRQAAAEILLDYADWAGCDELESPAYEVCADIAFNSGIGRAKQYLTQSQGSSQQIAQQLNEQHRTDYQKWGGVHLPGWLNRADDRDKFINH